MREWTQLEMFQRLLPSFLVCFSFMPMGGTNPTSRTNFVECQSAIGTPFLLSDIICICCRSSGCNAYSAFKIDISIRLIDLVFSHAGILFPPRKTTISGTSLTFNVFATLDNRPASSIKNLTPGRSSPTFCAKLLYAGSSSLHFRHHDAPTNRTAVSTLWAAVMPIMSFSSPAEVMFRPISSSENMSIADSFNPCSQHWWKERRSR